MCLEMPFFFKPFSEGAVKVVFHKETQRVVTSERVPWQFTFRDNISSVF